MMYNYNLLSWRLGTRLKTREPDVFSGFPTVTRALTVLTLMLFLLTSCFTDVKGQTTVTIPAANTNSNSARQPLASWWGFERTELLYLNSEIGQTGTITSIAFYVNSLSSPAASTPVQIRMATTSNTTVAQGTYPTRSTGSTLVFNGNVLSSSLVTGSWVTITLDTPFNYTGDNLVVFVETNNGGGGSGESSTAKQFRRTNLGTGVNRFQSWNTDTSPPTGNGTLATSRTNIQLTFASAAPCGGQPNAGTVSITSSSGCANVNFTLNSSGLSSGSGISYQWQSSSSASGPWANIDGATSTSLSTSAATETFYRLRTFCENSEEESFTNSVSYNVTLSGPCLCGSYSSIYPTSASDTEISSVTVGSMTNSLNTCSVAAPGTGSIAGRYSNFTSSVAGPSVQQGVSVPFTVVQGSCLDNYSNLIQIYVDWNQNGIFETSERVFESGSALNTAPGVSGSFEVPISASAGSTRMRIVCVEGGVAGVNYTTTAWPIIFGASYGEVEDYCFEVLEAENCAGVPNEGVASSSVSTACVGFNFQLSSSDLTIGLGITYQWQSSSSESGPWSDIIGANGVAYTTNITEDTYFRLRTYCSNSEEESFTNVVLVSFTSAPAYCGSYCVPTYDFGKTDGDLISNISILGTTLSNNSGTAPVNPAYTFFFGAPNLTAELQAGSTYTVSVTVGTFGNQNIAAWIDYNDDGVFDASERIGFTTASIAANGTATFQISLACNPPLGDHRLRIRDVFNVAGNLINPCSNYGYGETEDYVVTITAPDPCPVPKNLTAANGTPTSGDLSWDLGCAEDAWEVVVQPQGSGAPAGSGTPVATNSFSVSDLEPGVYEFYVRANCDEDGFSDWAGPFIFTPLACTTNVFPADEAVDVAIGAGEILFSWEANPNATGYQFWLGTSLANLTNLGTAASNTVNVTGIQKQTTYFWYVVPLNSIGAALGCDATVTTFTTEDADPGDICATAFNLDELTSPITASTVGFTNASNPACGGNTAPDLFYSVTVPADFTLVIGQTVNDYDSRNLVYFGTCDSGTIIECFDDPDTTQVTWTNTTGVEQTVYWVQDGFGSGAGEFTLAWSVNAPPIVITSFAPPTVCEDSLNDGEDIQVLGSNFTDVTSVTVGGVAAAFEVVSNTELIINLTNAHFAGGLIEMENPFTSVVSESGISVLANPTVNPITGVDTYCKPNGSNGTFQLTVVDAIGSDWSSSDTNIATVDGNGLVTALGTGTVTITFSVNDGSCTTSVSKDIEIFEQVVISGQTFVQTVVTGNTANFSVTVSGTISGYQWFYNDGLDDVEIANGLGDFGETYSGANTATLTISDTPDDMNGFFFYCIISGTSPCDDATSDFATLNVGDTGIETDPSNASVCDTPGEATFTVVASGTVDEYTWEVDQDGTENWQLIDNTDLFGLTFSGFDTEELSISGLTVANNGWRFRAVVFGPANQADSNAALLTVNESVSVTSAPTSDVVCQNPTGSTNFTVAASGNIAGYAWEYSADGVGYAPVANGLPAGITYGGTTSATLVVNRAASTPTGVYYYRAVVLGSGACPNAISDAATLTITAPAVSIEASSTLYCVPGEAVTLTASGASTYSWSPAAGLSATSGAVVTATPSSTTTYTVTGTDTEGCQSTSSVTITVSTGVAATLTSSADTVCPDEEVLLTTLATQPPTPAANTYLFSTTTGVSLISMDGSTQLVGTGQDDTASAVTNIGFSFNFNGVNYTQFSVNANGLMRLGSDAVSTAWTNSAANANTNAPAIMPYWDDLSTGTNGSIRYRVVGSAPNRTLVVQWNMVVPRISATGGTANATFQAWLQESTNTIQFVYGNGMAVNSANSGYTIGIAASSSNYQTVNANTHANSTSTFTVNNTVAIASGRSYTYNPNSFQTYDYEWSSVPAGFTSTDANPTVSPSETTTYIVTVSNSAGCSTTEEITVQVETGATIDAQPEDVVACAGTDVSFTVGATGPGLQYQWRKDGVDIEGNPSALTATLSILDASVEDSGSYDVVITPDCGSVVTSDSASLVIIPLPTAEITVNSACEGQDISFSLASNGTHFLWSGPNGFTSTDQNPVIPAATTAANGTYTVLITNGEDPIPDPIQVNSTGGPSTIVSTGAFSVYPWNVNVSEIPSGASLASVTLNWGTTEVPTGTAGCPTCEHTFAGDVRAALVNPNGDVIMLLGGAGVGGDLNGSYTFADNGVAIGSVAANATTGNLPNTATGGVVYRPTAGTGTYSFASGGPQNVVNSGIPTLSSLNSGDLNGTWQLWLFDAAAGDGGSLVSWTLNFQEPLAEGECTSSASVSVTVNLTPVLVVTPSAPEVCTVGSAVGVVASNIPFVLSTEAGCLNSPNGQWPSGSFTLPGCNGVVYNVTTEGWTGEYSTINVVAGNRYTFSSSVATDLVTVGNNTSTTVFASNIGSVTWTATLTGTIRFFLHNNTSCEHAQVSRTRRVSCSGPDSATYTWSPVAGLFTDAAGTVPYAGEQASVVYAKPSETTLYTVTSTSNAACENTAEVTVVVNVATVWYADADGDGFGNDEITMMACNQPTGYAAQGGDCNDNDATIYPGAVEICYDGILQNCDGELTDGCPAVTTTFWPTVCDATLPSINTSIRPFTTFINQLPSGVSVTGYNFRITNLATSAVREVEKSTAMIRITETDIANFGTDYFVEVSIRLNAEWQPYGPGCIISTPALPTTTLNATSCGATLPVMQSRVFATTVTGATGYLFEVSRMSGATAVQTLNIETTGNSFRLTDVPGLVLLYATEYQVRVQVRSLVEGAEVYSSFGSVCSVFTPDAPEAAMIGCDLEVGLTPATLNTLNYATALADATLYRFTLTDGVYNQVLTTPTRGFRLSQFNALSPLTAGATYTVLVEVQLYGVFYAGKDCSITVPGGARMVDPITQAPEVVDIFDGFKALASPNPFEEGFSINVYTNSTQPVGVAIYDMTGRLLETREVGVDVLSGQLFGERYPSGVYNIVVTQDEEMKTVRVIKK